MAVNPLSANLIDAHCYILSVQHFYFFYFQAVLNVFDTFVTLGFPYLRFIKFLLLSGLWLFRPVLFLWIWYNIICRKYTWSVVCLQWCEERRWLFVFSDVRRGGRCCSSVIASHHWRQTTTPSPNITEDQQPPSHLTSLKTNNHLGEEVAVCRQWC
jgi:hypothetical protein